MGRGGGGAAASPPHPPPPEPARRPAQAARQELDCTTALTLCNTVCMALNFGQNQHGESFNGIPLNKKNPYFIFGWDCETRGKFCVWIYFGGKSNCQVRNCNMFAYTFLQSFC